MVIRDLIKHLINIAILFTILLACHNSGFGQSTSFGPQRVLSDSLSGASAVFACDLDGDNDIDIIAGGANSGQIVWFENDGNANFSPEQLITNSADGVNSVYAMDLDKDGITDVLSASEFDDKVAWYPYFGMGVFGMQQIISTAANGARSVYAVDLDGDTHVDVLSASAWDDKIAWYRNAGFGSYGAQQPISNNADFATAVYAADLDGDGDMDVLSSSSDDYKIAWYENDGSGSFGTENIISTNAEIAYSVYAADLDGDGDMDVLSASYIDNKTAWYENDGSGNFSAEKPLSTNDKGALFVLAADLDRDEDMDVLSVANTDGKVYWYENDSLGGFSSRYELCIGLQGPWSVCAADLDGDKDNDVITASMVDNAIAWYRNELDWFRLDIADTRNYFTVDLDLKVINGYPPHSYLWSNAATTQDITVLTEGKYYVSVTDDSGYVAIDSIDAVFLPIPPIYTTITISPYPTSASLTLTVDSGIAPFTYEWSNAETDQNIIAYTEEMYYVTVTDSLGTQAIDSIESAFYVPPFYTSITTDPGYLSSDLDLETTGGKTPYTYLWSTGDTGEDITVSSEGVYFVTVVDFDTDTVIDTVQVAFWPPLSIYTTVTTYTGNCNADLKLNVDGGVSPFSYRWSNAATTRNITLTGDAWYYVTVTDSIGTQKRDSAEIYIGLQELAVSDLQVEQPYCASFPSGEIRLSATGGYGIKRYDRGRGAQLTPVFRNMESGYYQITVTDGCGHTAYSDPITLTAPPLISPGTIIITDNPCHADSLGELKAIATGGVGPLQYNIGQGWQDTGLFEGLPARDYTLQIRDSLMCIGQEMITLGQPDEIIISESITPLACASANNGRVAFTVNGGNSPFQYQMGDESNSTGLFAGLLSGSYMLSLSDADNCTATRDIYVPVNSLDRIELDYIRVSDDHCNRNQGKAEVIIYNGTGPFTYQVSGQEALDNNVAKNLGQGHYGLTVSDATGCYTTDSFRVRNIGGIRITDTLVSHPLCYGAHNGSVEVSATGYGQLSYDIGRGSQIQRSFTQLSPGSYMLTITDEQGCSDSLPLQLDYKQSIELSANLHHIDCMECRGQIELSCTGGSEPYTYLWNDNYYKSVRENIPAGTYYVQVRDAEGCFATDTFELENTSSIKADGHADEMHAYPNPCNGVFFIESQSLTNNCKLNLLDIHGKSIQADVQPSANNMLRLDITQATAGIYFLYLNCKGKITTIPIVKYTDQ